MKITLSLSAVVVFLLICALLSACASAEKSAGMFFENAGSVVNHEGDKLFIDPSATPIPPQK